MTPPNVFQKYVRILFGLKLAVLLSAIGISLVSINTMKDDSDWVSHTYEVKSSINQIEATICRNTAATRGYVITRETKLLGSVDQTWQQIDDIIIRLQTLTHDNAIQQDRIKGIAEQVKLRKAIGDRIVAAKTPEEAAGVMSDPATQATLDELHVLYASMLSEEDSLLAKRVAKMESTVHNAEVVLPLLIIVTIILLIILYVVTEKQSAC